MKFFKGRAVEVGLMYFKPPLNLQDSFLFFEVNLHFFNMLL